MPSRPLGQLLVERGVLTEAQLEHALAEQRETGRSLGDIIVQRDFATSVVLENALEGSDLGGRTGNVIEFATSRSSPTSDADGRDGDVEWRRKLFDLGEDAGEASPPTLPERESRPRGMRARLTRSLEAYLSRTAADLDERGEALLARSRALEDESGRLDEIEVVLERRAQRLRELELAGKETATQIDELVALLAERDATLKEISRDRDGARRELESAEQRLAESAAAAVERDRLLVSSDAKAAGLEEEIEALRAAQRESEATFAGISRDRDDARRELEGAQRRLAESAAAAVERDRLLVSSDAKAAGLEEEIEALRAAHRESEATFAEISRDRDDARRELESAQRRLAALEGEVEALRAADGAAQTTIAEREESMSELSRELERVQDELSESERRLEELDRRSVEFESVDEQRRAELARRDTTIDELRAKLERQLGREQEYEDRLEQKDSLLVERDDRLSRLLERLDQHEEELQRLEEHRRDQEDVLARAVAESAARQRGLSGPSDGLAARDEVFEAGHINEVAERGPAASMVHLLFVPVAGSYVLVERPGSAPRPGEEIIDGAHDGRRYFVARVGRSPLPLDERVCAYLQAVE